MSEPIPPELVTEILIRSQVDTLLRCSLHRSGSIQFRDQPKELCNTYELVVGSCNGLLCSTSLRTGVFSIQNPSTRKHYSFPSFLPSNCISKEGHGFGYDSVTGDYKVAAIVIVELLGIIQAQIFIGNVRTKACTVTQLPYMVSIRRDYMGVLVNGTLHWLVDTFYDDGRSARHVIMGLDLETEEFQEVSHPGRNESFDIDMYIGVLGTWLCVFVDHSKAGIDVWVMKEYRVQESWTKLFMIPFDVLSSNSCQIASLGFSKTGSEILLEVDCSRLVWYEIEGKKAVDITVQGLKNTPFMTVLCLRSLVPLDASVVGFDVDKLKQSQNSKQQKKKKDDFLSMGFKLKL
ncbi:F-box protein CPR1-like isoform X2 [Mercurialis annua]|uniref:F-box protein CPR1-like isoform X2 n=1 Tax=Mercurialis annua TaxID=3986 RepID=UPI002160BED0|nr:F-box protein CPR1-like isoform X2 [Mercurialis annua]